MIPESRISLTGGKVPVSRETRLRLDAYAKLLVQWQAKTNLVAASTLDDIWGRHMLDSLQVADCLGDADHVVDIGSGAGFPGLILAIMLAERGSGKVCLVESVGKKCAFMSAVVRETGLRQAGVDVQIINGRIEQELPKLPRPQIVCARALASLKDLLRYTEPFLSQGSVGLFPKGADHVEELTAAQADWAFDLETFESRLQAGSVILKISGLRPR